MQQKITVPEIHCDHCKTSIEGAVGEIDGVTRAEVDVEARTVHVEFDDGAVEMSAIVGVIEDQGYEVPGS